MSLTPKERVVVSGIGVVSSAGIGKNAFWDAINGSCSTVRKLGRFDTASHGCQVAAEIRQFDIKEFTTSKIRSYMDRSGAYAVAAAMDCLKDANFTSKHPDYEQLDIYLGSCCGAQEWIEREFRRAWQTSVSELHPLTSVLAHPGNVIGLVTIVLGVHGRGILVSNLDLSGVDALGCGFRLIRSGLSKRVLVGSTEAPITPSIFTIFENAGMLTHHNSQPCQASRPFDARRDGLVLGEGSVMLLLEERAEALNRGAHIYSEIRGYSLATDYVCSNGQSAQRNGRHSRNPIVSALEGARVSPDELDYINAEGTSLPGQDRTEVAAIQCALKRDVCGRVPASSITSVMGYALSTSGLMQAATCCLTYERSLLPPLRNYEYPDPHCSLRFVVNRPETLTPRFVLQSSCSALQPRSAAVVFGRPMDC